MSFDTKKINNEKVQPLKFKKPPDTRPVKGWALFARLYCIIYLCARKNSGKTWALSTILRRCCGPRTKIIAFCGTLELDPAWEAIQEWAERKGLPFEGYTSMMEGRTNMLRSYIEDAKEKKAKAKGGKLFLLDEEEEEPERREKYQYPDVVFIIDDLSGELRQPIIAEFLKMHRHFKAKIIVSSQYVNDMAPGARSQIDYFLLFGGTPKKKVEEVRACAEAAMSEEQFWRVYKFATAEPFSFLYYNQRVAIDEAFRRNFDTLIEVPSDDDEE